MKTINAQSVSLISAADLTGNQPDALNRFESSVADAIGGLSPYSTEGRVALRLSTANGARFVQRLGGTTYQYARWAVIDPRDGETMLIETADDRGRWINANCRPWNGGNRL